MKYRTIVADPPWDHSDGTGWNPGEKDWRGSLGYPARQTGLPYRLGWDTWGNESIAHVEMTA